VSALEDRLRGAFRADAELVRPETIRRLRDPATRPAALRRGSFGPRRLLSSMAVVMAMVLIAVGLSVAPTLLGGNAHHANRRPVGPVTKTVFPRFYVTAWGSLIMRDSSTGKITGQLSPPHGMSFAVVAATAGDRTFVTAGELITRQGCTAQLYSFRLNELGQPGPLTPLHITVPGNFNVTGGFAVTPDGRTIASTTFLCGQGQQELRVINRATGRTRIWTNPLAFSGDLSLSADGRLLAFIPLGESATRLLRTSAPAGSVAARSRPVSRGMVWGILASNGRSLYGCTVSQERGAPSAGVVQHGTVTYYQQSIATGRRKTLVSWHNVAWPYCTATLDPSGRYLLIQYPVNVPNHSDWAVPVALDIRTGRIARIPAPAFEGPADIAW
jgi:hypothetical protein